MESERDDEETGVDDDDDWGTLVGLVLVALVARSSNSHSACGATSSVQENLLSRNSGVVCASRFPEVPRRGGGFVTGSNPIHRRYLIEFNKRKMEDVLQRKKYDLLGAVFAWPEPVWGKRKNSVKWFEIAEQKIS